MVKLNVKAVSRRRFLVGSAAVAGTIALKATASEYLAVDARKPRTAIVGRGAPAKADDETYWGHIAKLYDVTPEITNLENGYWGIMARPVLKEYKQHTDFVNRNNTLFARFDEDETYQRLRKTVAKFLNVGEDEIALTRGATEALQSLIGGYNKLGVGDTVLYADLDYSEMKSAMRWLEDRRGVNVVKVEWHLIKPQAFHHVRVF